MDHREIVKLRLLYDSHPTNFHLLHLTLPDLLFYNWKYVKIGQKIRLPVILTKEIPFEVTLARGWSELVIKTTFKNSEPCYDENLNHEPKSKFPWSR